MSNRVISYTYRMLDNVSRPMRKMARNATNSTRTMGRMANTAKNAGGALNRMGNAASNSGGRLRRLGRDADYADRRLHRLARRMRNMQTIRLGMGGALTGLGAGLVTRRVGSSLINYEGAMNTALSKMVESEGPGGLILKGFEPASNKAKDIAASVKASNLAIKALRAETMKIARVSKFTPTDVAEGLTELASAGINATKALGMLHPVMRLAGATGVDAGLAADFVTNVSNQFGVPLAELPDTVDMMATAINATNFKMQDLAASMKYAGASSFASGQDITRITAALMALAQVGEKGSSAGNALSRIFESLYKSSGPATKALKSIGLTQDSFLNKEGKAIPLVEIMEKLNGASQEFGYKKVQRVIQALFQARGGRGAKILMRVLKEIDEFEDQLIRKSKGRAKLMEKVMMSGIYGAYQEMRSSLYESIIALGDGGFSKDLEDIAIKIKELANSFSQLSPATKKWAGRLLLAATAISAVIIPLGVFMWALGALIPFFALIITPIGLITAGVIALGAALTSVFAKHWDGSQLQSLFQSLQSQMGALSESVLSFLATDNPIANVFKTALDYATQLVGVISKIPSYIMNPMKAAKDFAGFNRSITNRLVSGASKVGAWLPDLSVGKDRRDLLSGNSLAQSQADKELALRVETENRVKVDAPGSITLKLPNGMIAGTIPLTTSSDKGRTQIDSASVVAP